MLKKILVFLFLPLLCSAQTLPPEPSDYVTDNSGILTAEQKKALNIKCGDFEKATSNEINVYIADSLYGQDLESYTRDIFTNWHIGQKGKNNGVLIAVFIKDRKFRIQTGYGLEGALPDLLTKRIQDEDMRPFFRNTNYYEGINKGIDQIINYSKSEYKPGSSESSGDWIGWLIGYSANIILLGVYLYRLHKLRKKKRSATSRNLLTLLAFVLALIPCLGAIILFFMVIFIAEFKMGRVSGGGGNATYSDNYSSTSWNSSDSSSSDSSSDSGFDGGGGGDTGGGGSSGDW